MSNNYDMKTIELLMQYNIIDEHDFEKFRDIMKDTLDRLSIKESIANYEQYLIKQGKSDKTVLDYISYMKNYYTNILSKDIENDLFDKALFSENSIYSYLDYLKTNKNYKISTLNKSITILKSYIEFMHKAYNFTYFDLNYNIDDYYPDDSIYVLTEDKIRSLVSHSKDERYEFILWSIYYLGINRNTAIKLKFKDIDLNEKTATVNNGKSINKIKLNDEFIKRFNSYKNFLLEENQKSLNIKKSKNEPIDITENPLDPDEPLYPSNHWKRISLATLNRAFNYSLEQYISSIKKDCPYVSPIKYLESNFTVLSLQDSRRYSLYKKGLSIEQIQEYIQDPDVNTTLIKLNRSKEIF